MTMARIAIEELQVDERLAAFVNERALPGTGVDADAFWKGLSALIHEFGPKNRELLAVRDELQAKIDDWHRKNREIEPEAYEAFLREIGYLTPAGPDFAVDTQNVDPEISSVPGPQLVVPVMNARYALNAANARWGSLYDALYGTDAMGDLPKGGGYSPERGARVVAWAKAFLDEVAPVTGASHADVTDYVVSAQGLMAKTAKGTTTLADAGQFAGHAGDGSTPSAILLRNNGLHIEIVLDRSHPIGSSDPAGVADVLPPALLHAGLHGDAGLDLGREDHVAVGLVLVLEPLDARHRDDPGGHAGLGEQAAGLDRDLDLGAGGDEHHLGLAVAVEQRCIRCWRGVPWEC